MCVKNVLLYKCHCSLNTLDNSANRIYAILESLAPLRNALSTLGRHNNGPRDSKSRRSSASLSNLYVGCNNAVLVGTQRFKHFGLLCQNHSCLLFAAQKFPQNSSYSLKLERNDGMIIQYNLS